MRIPSTAGAKADTPASVPEAPGSLSVKSHMVRVPRRQPHGRVHAGLLSLDPPRTSQPELQGGAASIPLALQPSPRALRGCSTLSRAGGGGRVLRGVTMFSVLMAPE